MFLREMPPIADLVGDDAGRLAMPLAVETGIVKLSVAGSKPARAASADVSTVVVAPVSTSGIDGRAVDRDAASKWPSGRFCSVTVGAAVAVGDRQRAAGNQAAADAARDILQFVAVLVAGDRGRG